MNTESTAPDEGDAGAPPPAAHVRWPGLVLAVRTVRKSIDRVLAVLCIVAFTLLVAIVSWQVFTREVLNNSAPWTEEAARYTFVVLAIFAAAYVFSERGHIAVTMLVEKLPFAGQRVWSIVLELIVMFFIIAVFIIGGSRLASGSWTQASSTLPLTLGQVYLVLPIAGAIILFYSVAHIIGILAGSVSPIAEIDENAEAV